MNKQSNNAEIVEFSSIDARKWLEKYSYHGQRTVRTWWTRHLNRQMGEGKFADFTSIHLAHVEGHTYIIDGNHRLTAMSYGGITPVKFVVTHHYITETGEKGKEDLAQLYTRLDQGLKRSFSDISGVWDMLERTDLRNKTQLNKVNSACNVIANDWGLDGRKRGRRMDLEESVDNAIEWAPYAIPFFEAVRKGELGHLITKAGVMGVALITFRHEAELAEDFWHQVSVNDGLGRYDPRARLHRWLLEARRFNGQMTNTRTFVNHEFALVCARCWNAYIDHVELKKLFIPKMPVEGYLIKLTGHRVGSTKNIG